MGRKSKTEARGQNTQVVNPSQNQGGKGLPGTEDSKKVRNLDAIYGIVLLDMDQVSTTSTPIIILAKTQNEIVERGSDVSRRSWADMAEEETIALAAKGKTQTL